VRVGGWLVTGVQTVGTSTVAEILRRRPEAEIPEAEIPGR
jgi:predicted kinase